jgi:hypothetical protein
MSQLGETVTIYGMLHRVVEIEGRGSAEALWFERKSWTYSELKDRMLFSSCLDQLSIPY